MINPFRAQKPKGEINRLSLWMPDLVLNGIIELTLTNEVKASIMVVFIVYLRAGVALPLRRCEGGDGVLRGCGVARQDLDVSVATRLHSNTG